MNSYEIRIIVNVIAQDDNDAYEKATMAVIEDNGVEVDDVHIISSEEYS